MKKEIIKPFDLEKAKAGAKLRTRDGRSVEIFKWDARGNYPIKGMIIQDKEDVSACWTLEGAWMINPSGNYSLVIVEEVEEPKFKVKDWVIDKQGIVHQIANVIMTVTNNTYGYDIVDGGYFNDNTEGVRLWTIKDAKAGDVLVDTEGSVFIFRKICEGYPNAYGGINIINEFAHAYESGYWTSKPCFPATKEQRDLLFQKMEEAGYEWDADALKLKKITKFWSDTTGAKLEGFFISHSSNIHKTNSVLCCTSHNIFATEKQAKSALAMARISQIMANDIEHFGGAITDEEWENDEWKFVIYRNGCSISTTSIMNDYYFLAFHTEKQRDLFLEKYPQLVKDYFMIDE